MLVDTTSVCLIIGPVSVINVTIYVNESAFAVGSVLTPLSGVFGPIVPVLFTEAISEPTLPLTRIHGSRLEGVRRPLLSVLVGIVHVFGHSFSCLFLGEVLAAGHLFRSQHRM